MKSKQMNGGRNVAYEGSINAGLLLYPGALNPADFMPKAITTALITNLGSKALTKLGDKLVKSNDEELESRIREQVEAFISGHEQQLAIICASQAYSSGQASCSESSYNAILENANKLIQKHVRRYHGDAQTIAKGVASGVFGLAVSGNPIGLATYAASAGIDAGIGLFEATSSTDYVLKALSSSVASQASSSTTAYAMFLKDLTSSYTTDTSAIYQELTINSWPTNTNQLPCQDLDTIKLSPHFEPKRSGIKSICDKVSSLFTKTTSQAAKSFLSNSLTQKLLNRMRGIISTGFVQPTASFAASALAAKVNQALEEHKARQRAAEAKQQKISKTQKTVKTSRPSSSRGKSNKHQLEEAKFIHKKMEEFHANLKEKLPLEQQQEFIKAIKFAIETGREAARQETDSKAFGLVQIRIDEALKAGTMGAAVGAEIGMFFGPAGAGVGAATGGVIGGVIGYNKDPIIQTCAELIQKFDNTANTAESQITAANAYAKFFDIASHLGPLPKTLNFLRNTPMKFATANGADFAAGTATTTGGRRATAFYNTNAGMQTKTTTFVPGTTQQKALASQTSFADLYRSGKIVYKDSSKHHINSQGVASAAPKNPAIIKDSIAVKGTSDLRVAVDQKNNEIVVFRATETKVDGTVEYHGYTALWKANSDRDINRVLDDAAKSALLRGGLVKRNGKIICIK